MRASRGVAIARQVGTELSPAPLSNRHSISVLRFRSGPGSVHELLAVVKNRRALAIDHRSSADITIPRADSFDQGFRPLRFSELWLAGAPGRTGLHMHALGRLVRGGSAGLGEDERLGASIDVPFRISGATATMARCLMIVPSARARSRSRRIGQAGAVP